ncbi:hypothetical protein [Methylophilus medardicus]|uniref:Uncharacterized protein n=1 Tax=Methylophilus medardicus TaxID=2588534 RepID=A0A5B8CPN8_9PROT|nr:hypothetical protein [Methylophilus medardicus]QDC43225.1 hypothetical protein FIU01_00915 [Methylophilus medardicus]QDC48232.1 hypothetical protein FIU00_00915 [Methylophilus medardicus]QDC51937.1 hypothetical protein FIT99_00915 [Methylophilus medardicus]
MAKDAPNLIEEIIDNALNPATHLEHDGVTPAPPEAKNGDALKQAPDDPRNGNLMPELDQP